MIASVKALRSLFVVIAAWRWWAEAHPTARRFPMGLGAVTGHRTFMPNYRRHRIAGGCYFFTVALEDRTSSLLVERIADLRKAFWFRNEEDLRAYVDYIHFNPVKHGYVEHPADWPHTTYHRWRRVGLGPPSPFPECDEQ